MSGQMMTHFTVRKEKGVTDSKTQAAADEGGALTELAAGGKRKPTSSPG